jgi:hypothetical protein
VSVLHAARVGAVAGGERRCSGLPPRRPVQNPQLLPHVRGLVALWRKCDNHGPIGFALADPVADAWQAANPHLLRAQALGLAGRRVGGRPPRRERIDKCLSPGPSSKRLRQQCVKSAPSSSGLGPAWIGRLEPSLPRARGWVAPLRERSRGRSHRRCRCASALLGELYAAPSYLSSDRGCRSSRFVLQTVSSAATTLTQNWLPALAWISASAMSGGRAVR